MVSPIFITKPNTDNYYSPLVFRSSDVPKAVIDETTIESTLEVAEIGTISDLDVQLNIEDHWWINDLVVTLIAQDGTEIRLASYPDVVGGGYDGAMFDDEGRDLEARWWDFPFNKSYKPVESLSRLDGQPIEGVWTLLDLIIGYPVYRADTVR